MSHRNVYPGAVPNGSNKNAMHSLLPFSAIHRMPSDSEVIIASELDGTGTRHKVLIPPSMTPRSLFKKPRINTRFPFLMICVIFCGLLLLFIILLATSAETWFSSGRDRSTDYDDAQELLGHVS